ncbi:hypothetical protein M3I53_01165 [Paraburkholderia sp. CNPSo 3272]|uniref:hypothetical protein n=1 Tax=Paraburkholderia sp. CNPSo 3272 TaxID=2940931 RepID=UPI0020B69CE2|nr:hypothetical protein [Paraburkholderia sp. CNPSo 3272]MCP3721746.1 hypothetical protein [Paraburkholderia sp. CNPSo 3272]
MILEVQLSLPADHSKHVGRMGGSGPPSYFFGATVRAVRRITSRYQPNWLNPWAVSALVLLPEHLSRFLGEADKRWAGDGCAWLPADINRHEGNKAALGEFIVSGALELTLEEAT